jgi:transposase
MKMTVKEIAELAKCSKSTIGNRIREIMPENSAGPGRKTMLSEDEAYIIIASVTGKEYMTPGEIADVAGCHVKTVYRVANKLYPDARGGKGCALKYDKDQCRDLMKQKDTWRICILEIHFSIEKLSR